MFAECHVFHDRLDMCDVLLGLGRWTDFVLLRPGRLAGHLIQYDLSLLPQTLQTALCRQTDRQTDKQTVRQSDRQTDSQFNSIQMSFIGTRKHTFTLPKQVSKTIQVTIGKNNKKTVVKGEHIYSWRG